MRSRTFNYNIIDIYYLLAKKEAELIMSALSEIESVSCIIFYPRSYEKDYIEFVNNPYCSSNVGRTGGRQVVSLANSDHKYNCMEKGVVIHEVLHALGFLHMQSSTDRDRFVKVNYENISSGMKQNFLKYDSTRFGTPYDFKSIMHYGAYYFSKNNKPTLEPLSKSYRISDLGQRQQMTSGDIQRLNEMYQCESS